MVEVRIHGDSLSACAVAFELAEVGLDVRVLLPAAGAAGSGHWPDGPVADADGAIATLLDRIAAPISAGGTELHGVRPVQVPPGPVFMRDARGAWSRVPEPAVLGIPAVPVSADSLAFLPTGAAFRAYLDRVKPLLTVGKTHELGKLVRSRFGDGLFERLVAPLVRERFGTVDVEVAIAAPGLNETFSRAGSLSAAVLAYSERHARQETRVAPADGWQAARELIMERLGHYGVEFAPSAEAAEDVVVVDAGLDALSSAANGAEAGMPPEIVEALHALRPRRLRARARALVAQAGGVDRGFAGVLDEPGAEAVLEVDAPNGDLWSVRVAAAGDGALEARLAGPATSEPGDALADARAALAASGLVAEAQLVAEVRAAPFVSLAERDTARALLGAERRANGELLVVGEALHGGDLAAAVADAVAEAIALRRRLLGISE
ncbi:hypothetical protein [Leucobacter sp. gxy201]|uniref:hypothetical protein n=1 Tax=Leucobacter sp. gxy201 TaxID=2957200 RepID=UPI003DA12E55